MDTYEREELAEWLEFVEQSLRTSARLAVGHISLDRATEILQEEMLDQTRSLELKRVTASLLLGESERNFGRLAGKRSMHNDPTVVRVMLEALVRARPGSLSVWEVLKVLNAHRLYRDVDQLRVEEILEEMIKEEWVIQEGQRYRLVDTSHVQGRSSRASRRSRLASYGGDILGAMDGWLAGEEAAGLHVVTLYATQEEFDGMMEFVRAQTDNYWKNHHNRRKGPEDGDQQFSVVILTRRRK